MGRRCVHWPSADFPAENGRDINHFNGIIDDFKYWSFAMEEDQVLDESDDPPGEGCEDGGPEGVLVKPGDVNGDAGYNISDVVAHLDFLFSGSALPECYVVPDSNPVTLTDQGLEIVDFNGDGKSDIADSIASLQRLFSGGDPHPLGEECAEIEAGSCSDNCE